MGIAHLTVCLFCVLVSGSELPGRTQCSYLPLDDLPTSSCSLEIASASHLRAGFSKETEPVDETNI